MPNARRETALTRLAAQVPGLQVQYDPLTGSPGHLQSTGRFLTSPAAPGVTPKQAVADFIEAYADLFGHSAAALRSARVTREDVTQHNGMHTLVWNQEVNGIPVFKSILKANVTRKGEIITVGDHFMAAPQVIGGKPPMDAVQAIALAAAALDETLKPADIKASGTPSGAERKQRFTAPGMSDTSAQLTYFPMDGNSVRLGWDVTLFSLANNEMFNLVVGAETGEMLYGQSLTESISDASYKVFADPTTKQPLESPSPKAPSFDPPTTTTQPPEVSRQMVTLPALNTMASPNGWIDDGVTETRGNNIDAHTDTNADNVADTPRPNGGPSRIFDFTANFAQSPSTYRDAAVTQLFYYTNWTHDRL